MYFKKSNKWFIHVDCDSFFASCEILRNPHLKGERVCVWWEIIIACSYEAKAIWIKTWTPIWEAKKILGKHGYFFLPDHNFYTEISEKIENYLTYNTLKYEPFSIDEGFCEITGLPEMYKITLWTYLRRLQKNILKEIWIPVSIWCSNTRIKAKMFSKLNKPYWIYIWLSTEQEAKLFKSLPLKNIPYIWKAYQERFKSSCKTVYDFIQLWFWEIKKEIGKIWTDLRLELCWVNAFVVKKSHESKSVWRTRSFNKQITSNYDFLKEQLLLNFDSVFEHICEKNIEIKIVSIMLRDKNFYTYVYDYKLAEHTNIRKNILEIMLYLFDTYYSSEKTYRSTWVILSEFKNYLPKQTSIFDKPLRSKENEYKLTKVINLINEKYWSHKVSFWISLIWKWFEAKLGIRKY